ncbi:trypsin-3-like [Cloeon dipterum]|uniref:trypsin-3-like n=1 Tax=Cloeon dipterum TaxID=197152 RepID=UPI00322050D6
MLRKAVIVLACCTALVCGGTSAVRQVQPHEVEPRESNRVDGGIPVALGDFPWHVTIDANDENIQLWVFRCEGAIISNLFVIASYYCGSQQGEEIRVVAGYVDKNVPFTGQVSYVIDTIVSPVNYVALLKLSAPIEFTPDIGPVMLPPADATSDPGTGMIVTGWGEGNQVDQIMRLDIFVISFLSCNSFHPEVDLTNILCAGASNSEIGMCSNRNPGAPLVYNGELRGVFFSQYEPCYNYYPAFYADIPRYRDWIQQIAGV